MKEILTEIELDGVPMRVYQTKKTKVTEESPHSSFCFKGNEALNDTAAFKYITKDLEKVDSVLEVFGGTGWVTSSIQKNLKPSKHVALDIAESCVKSIKVSFPQVDTFQTDSFEYIKRATCFDLIVCDFNNFTFKKYWTDPKIKSFVDSIFSHSKKYVTIGDSTMFGIYRFRKNLDAYENIFNRPLKSWREYFPPMGDYFFNMYGFSLTKVVLPKGKICAFLLFEKSKKQKPFTIEDCPIEIPLIIKQENIPNLGEFF